MIWTYCELVVIADDGLLQRFVADHELQAGKPLSLSKVVPVVSFEDEALLDAWGCSGLPEEVGIAYQDGPSLCRLRFRVPGGPPLSWLSRASRKYSDFSFFLKHATEATGVYGEVYHSNGITKTTEVEGDIRMVERSISEISKGR